MAYIKVTEPHEAEGRLKEIYDKLIQERGKLAEVHKIQSLNPESIVKHIDFYMHIMFGASTLKRYQREMIAVVVSMSNNCEYCQMHHGAALNHFWKDEQKLNALKKDFYKASLAPQDIALCEYAAELTQNPNSISKDKHISKLQSLGLDDKAILDATLIIGYFNFVNRLVLGLGVELEADKGEGYKYD